MIRVFDPVIAREDIDAVVGALKRGEISGSFGQAIPAFEDAFASFVGCRYGVAVTSGSTALHLAVAAAGMGPGDEVLLSACTNIATALAVVHNGAVPVPVDSEEETWNLDPDLLEGLVTSRTKAIIPVHVYGHPARMDEIGSFAREHDLIVIEDCAESHGATYRGKMTGSLGHMACFSFYANKVITTGEGGMVTTNDPMLAERLRLLRNLGFTEPRFRHEVAGFNFRMAGYQAAMGLSQLKRIDSILAEKRRVAQAYGRFLGRLPGLRLPPETDWARNIYWMYAIEIQPEFGISRNELAARLLAHGIETRTFFCPMNRQPCLASAPGFRDTECRVAERLWETGMYLPSSITLDATTIEGIARTVADAGGHRL